MLGVEKYIMKGNLEMFAKYWSADRDEFSNRDTDALIGWKENYPYISDCHKIIDIGCGIGNTVDWLTKKGHSALGITYQDKEVTEAKRLNRLVLKCDMHDLDTNYDDTRYNPPFDAFIMWDSLEHSIAPLVALCEAKKATRNGGKGIIFIPSQDWIECRYHIIVPTIRQMKHLLILAELEINDIIDMGNEQAVYKLIVKK